MQTLLKNAFTATISVISNIGAGFLSNPADEGFGGQEITMTIQASSVNSATRAVQASIATDSKREVASSENKVRADTLELSPAAQKLVQSGNGPTPQQAQQLAALYASARGMVSANPTKARNSLQNIIAQYPNSPEAQKARIQLTQLPAES